MKEGNELQALRVACHNPGRHDLMLYVSGGLSKETWEGGTTVCRSRGEQKAPAEDLLQISVCKARGDVGTIETLRATLHQESRQCHAMGAVPW